MFIKLFLNAFKFRSVGVKNMIILVLQIVSQRISLQDVLKLCQKFQ